MYCLETDIAYSPRSKRHIKRRGILRQLIQASFLVGLAATALLFGRDLMWRNHISSLRDESIEFIQDKAAVPVTTVQQDNISTEYDLVTHLHPDYTHDREIPLETWQSLPVRGVLYMLVRNEDIQGARRAMKSVEDRFNHRLRYPWVLLNNQDFSSDFRKYIRKATQAPLFFGKIDPNVWSYPSWIDVPIAESRMLEMLRMGIYKAGSLSFHQLLRYQSGLFYHHPLFKDAEYVWRVEPESTYTCNMPFDPFDFMKSSNKSIAFTLTMRELPGAISSLWLTTRDFMKENPHFILAANETIMPWVLNDFGEYNYCHMWSNFEIVDLNFLRSKAYQEYFKLLDRRGGFFYERWSDAPVRTLAAAMFLPRDKIYFFNSIGYTHSVASHCPVNKDYEHCSCDMFDTFDFSSDSCTSGLLRLVDEKNLNEMLIFAKSQLQQ